MSGLVDKVKDVVRNRSRHRKSNSMGDYDSRSSTDFGTRKSGDYSNRDSMNETRTGRGRDPTDNMNVATNDFAGMNLNEQQPSKTLPPLPSGAVRNVQDASLQQREAEQGIQQGNTNSPTSVLHRKKFSRPENDYMDDGASIPPRKSSAMTRKPLPGTGAADTTAIPVNGSSTIRPYNNDGTGGSNALSTDRTTAMTDNGPHDPRSRDIAPNDPSPLVPHHHKSSGLSSNRNDPSAIPGTHSSLPRTTHSAVIRDNPHLRLPEDFDLSNTEDTHVTTTYRPAITRETIHIPRTEIIHKAITRDIHVDHYHYYIQPVTVREVHPAVHYSIHPETGARTEIPAPAGFQLPDHLMPTDPRMSDHSHLRKTERHYVVDEQNPNGKLEDPPNNPRYKQDMDEMNREHAGYMQEHTKYHLLPAKTLSQTQTQTQNQNQNRI